MKEVTGGPTVLGPGVRADSPMCLGELRLSRGGGGWEKEG